MYTVYVGKHQIFLSYIPRTTARKLFEARERAANLGISFDLTKGNDFPIACSLDVSLPVPLVPNQVPARTAGRVRALLDRISCIKVLRHVKIARIAMKRGYRSLQRRSVEMDTDRRRSG